MKLKKKKGIQVGDELWYFHRSDKVPRKVKVVFVISDCDDRVVVEDPLPNRGKVVLSRRELHETVNEAKEYWADFLEGQISYERGRIREARRTLKELQEEIKDIRAAKPYKGPVKKRGRK